MTVIATEDSGGGGADLLRRLEPAGGDAPLKLCELCPHAFHGLDALGALEGRPLVGVNDENPHAGRTGSNLLDQRLGRLSLLAHRDARTAFNPWPGRALDGSVCNLRSVSVPRVQLH